MNADKQAQGGGDMTECGHSKYGPCHNCEPLDAPPSAPVGVAVGWVVVPREPTPEMVHEGACARMAVSDVRHTWDRMLASAPQPPAEAQAQGAGEVVEKPCKRCGDLVYVWAHHDDTCCLDCFAQGPSAEAGVYAALRSIRYNAEHGSQDRPLHVRLQLIAEDARRAIAACEAAPPSAPVGVDFVTRDMIDRVQDTMAMHRFAVPVRVVEDALRTYFMTADLAQQPAAVDGALVRRVLDFKPSWSGMSVRDYLIEGGMKHWSPGSYLRNDEKSKPYRIVEQALTAALAQQPAAEAQAQGGASADRMAIKMLVAAGYVTEAKANEALSIAHGFDKGPLAKAQGGGEVVALRAEQAAAVMPLIGPLLDAWERTHPDDSVHDSGIARYIEPINRAMEDGIAPSAPYSIDADADGIRARVADAITGALAFGAQGTHKPPAGHWLEPFWDMARADTAPPSAPVGVEDVQRRLDREKSDHERTIDQRDAAEDALGRMFQAVTGRPAEWSSAWGFVDAVEEVEEHVAALAQQPAAVDGAMVADAEDLALIAQEIGLDDPLSARILSVRTRVLAAAFRNAQPGGSDNGR